MQKTTRHEVTLSLIKTCTKLIAWKVGATKGIPSLLAIIFSILQVSIKHHPSTGKRSWIMACVYIAVFTAIK